MSEHGHELSFTEKYIFSVDHKVIGLQYMITSFIFLLIGFTMILIMRWQLAFPGTVIPIFGKLLPATFAPGGILGPTGYNQMGAMHGTIMVFLGIVPLAVGAFGNYVMPIQIGAPDMAFPRMNMLSYWVYLPGGILMLSSFLMPGGAAQSGWTSYPPLSVINPGQTVWLLSMVFLITSSLLGSMNFIVTVLNLRAPGMTLWRMPLFCWSQFVTAFILLLAFPPLEAAAILQLSDRVLHTSFFMPDGLVVAGQAAQYAGGGAVLLYQHLFWFLAHPEVYVLILPPFGIISEIIATNTRKPLFGYKEMVYAMMSIAAMSFLVWAHHMFLSGMSPALSNFFLITTMIISVPSVALLTCLILSLKGASIRFTTPMLFALSFLPMFGIGGLTGLPLGLTVTDIYLHDTYYVIGHFHYVVVTGSLMGLFGGVYHWFPKMFGRKMDDCLGKIHFWGSVIAMNGILMPMLVIGLQGQSRRLFDPTAQLHNLIGQPMHVLSTISAIALMLFQIPFIYNFFNSMFRGELVDSNPWKATTLDWDCPSPPPHGNFAKVPRVYRGPYEYSHPDHNEDWLPQSREHAEAAR
ncbi:MAG: cytochrome C oxidase subunit I [Elusimicrobia bacterium CG1_02_63_36]|nr:MAG: cytochrome C oxidase subunit I [Elusimicrobia bacterium CG1_02_63_36]PIP84402.1 MAG: cytochrome C oxidase subunit I [Elusimicrobia bacterium CG22_combo_CG10-13_8_21_14_all_63_91]PJA18655.1 MAG: cytochrome C oxidase subunit I [Elusimicrobia bacterium CG_4_10_14_0_2_um_filter_63_34]PJB23399.1 MAG: cytochrome C oxidase subunit I [Elusimicrobia bacterium CG_4_9_14_3_um_filter_62_55]